MDIAILISIVASIISGMVLFLMQRYFNRKSHKDDERDNSKRKENVLIMKSIHAVGKLTKANSIAVRDGKVNGEMHEAMDEYDKADSEMYNYLLEVNANK